MDKYKIMELNGFWLIICLLCYIVLHIGAAHAWWPHGLCQFILGKEDKYLHERDGNRFSGD